MFGRFIRNGFALVVATVLLSGAARADDWRIVQSNGQIWIGSNGVQQASLGPNEVVPGGATLTTGAGGRAMLVHGAQTLMVGPNAVVTVPSGESTGITTILQQAGEVTFDVDRQKVRHFAVETPYLAAVVKGTHFTVSIENDGATVSVDRGLVEVTDLATGERADTPAGQRATVGGPNSRFNVTGSGSGQLAIVTQGAPRSALVARLSGVQLAALQVTSADTASTSGLTTVRGDSQDGNPSLSLVAGASGGNDGGNTGSGPGNAKPNGETGTQIAGLGDTTEGPNGAAINASVVAVNSAANETLVLAQGAVAFDGAGDRAGSRFDRADGKDMTAVAVAIVFALSIMLAIGVAYLRRMVG